MEDDSLNIKIPKTISLIAITLFLERFCYYGIKTGLVMYLLWEMDYTESSAIIWCHAFVIIYNISNGLVFAFLQYCISSFAITWIGIACEVGGLGYMLFPHEVSDAEDNNKKMLDDFPMRSHFMGLCLVFIGAGLARPALMSLSVEHLKTENKSRLLDWQNISGVVAGMIATISAPYFRDEKITYKDELIHVNAIIFAVLISIAAICHVIGSINFYKALKRQELDSSELKSSLRSFKRIFRRDSDIENKSILLFFIPLIVIWSCLEQNFTFFVLQAYKSNLTLYDDVRIEPVHVMSLHPFFLLLLIPFNKHILDNLLEDTAFEKPLKKVVLGCFFAIAAFVCAFYYEKSLNNSISVPKGQEAHFRMFNAMECDYLVAVEGHEYFYLKHMEMHADTSRVLEDDYISVYYTIKLGTEGIEGFVKDVSDCPTKKDYIELRRGKAMGYVIKMNDSEVDLDGFEDNVARSKDLRAKIRILATTNEEKNISIINEQGEIIYNSSSSIIDQFKISPGKILVTVDNISVTLSEIEVLSGEVYAFMIVENEDQHDFQSVVVTPAPTVPIWKIIPQFFLLSFAKTIIGSNYQAWLYHKIPTQLAPLVAPFYFCTIISGNTLIIALQQVTFLDSEWHFGMFAILMGADVFILMTLMMIFLKTQSQVAILDQTRVIVL